ncbi:hypothetical protein [Paludisphaera rhizosphaerae]|uniref:hypothetical protein n=1 Tax=Paludisphaera rhizosphaerae TaxID=2711216 RepID=UPI001C6E0355|nr:hypothetical protein [Paludisphaera rhizosphaerae]
MEKGEFSTVSGFVYGFANLALIGGLLGRRFSVKQLALAVVVLAVAFKATQTGMGSLRHRLDTIKPGMTVEEVRRHMAGYQESGEVMTDERLISDGSIDFRDPTAPRSHVACGVVTIKNGRVAGVDFRPD